MSSSPPVGSPLLGVAARIGLGALRVNPLRTVLSTLGVPIVAGRGLTQADVTAQPVPTVITASLARLLWPAADPLGHVVTPVWRGAVS